MKLKHCLMGILASAGLASITYAADASLETLVGTQRVDTDMLIKGQPIEQIKFVVRDLPRVAYDGKTTNFLLGRAEFFDLYGLKPVLEGQKGDTFAIARSGVVYRDSFGNLELFLETVTNHSLNWEQTAITRYQLGPVDITIEGVLTMDKGKPTAISTMPRVRYNADRYSVGIGVNTLHINSGKQYKHTINPGVCTSVAF